MQKRGEKGRQKKLRKTRFYFNWRLLVRCGTAACRLQAHLALQQPKSVTFRHCKIHLVEIHRYSSIMAHHVPSFLPYILHLFLHTENEGHSFFYIDHNWFPVKCLPTTQSLSKINAVRILIMQSSWSPLSSLGMRNLGWMSSTRRLFLIIETLKSGLSRLLCL